MTTDITKLAQKRNAAISQLSGAFEPGHINQREVDALSYAVDVMNELVEALEKAQAKATQQGNIACALFDEVTQLRRHADEKAPELRAQLIEADSELEALRQRIAELESRTVTVKLPDDEDGQAYGFGKWANRAIPAAAGTMMISYCEDAWRAAFEVFSNAAGIKWEAE